jgi:hypothetical protein
MLRIGDLLERILRLAGITKERVQAVAGVEDCGCAKRQELLNQFGYRVQHRFISVLNFMQHAWHRARYSQLALRLEAFMQFQVRAFRVLFGKH